MNKLTSNTRRTLAMLSLVTLISIGWAPEPSNTYDSVVVVKVHNLTSDQFNQIVGAVGQKNQVNIDYYCLWSGIMVLKLANSTLHESGDIHLFTRNTLNDASNLEKIEILHVHTSISGIAKC